jgi:hypothetical protein
MQGGWPSTFCLAESDITDPLAFMEHSPYAEAIDASIWLVSEHRRLLRGDAGRQTRQAGSGK